MRRYVVLLLVLVTLSAGTFMSCSESRMPEDVRQALASSGKNLAELMKVLTHFESDPDTLKLKAAYFLIGNMEGHSYVQFEFVDTAGAKVEMDVASFPDYDSLLAAVDSIESERGELDYQRDTIVNDADVITADYLIQNIDLAFSAWRTKPWAKNLSFDDFCRYALPYRGSNEPLEEWRQFFLDKYAGLDTLLDDPLNSIEAAAAINNDIRSWFGFDRRWYLHPTDQGLAEMLETGFGRCEDMTNLTIYALRANAIAVTSDYTPYWANSGNNHAWNAIVVDGRAIPFMGAEADPGKYKLANQAAKVYRKTFDIQQDNLVFQDKKQTQVPRWLGGKNYVDVTAEYYDTRDITVRIDSTVPDSVDIAYLCVFNSGEFKPIHWGRIDGDSVTFTDMNTGLLYLPAFYLKEEIVPCSGPFYVSTSDSNTEATRTVFEVSSESARSIILDQIPVRSMAGSTESLKSRPLKAGEEYELRYWDDGWQTAATKVCSGSSFMFGDVPSGALCWLVAVDGDEDERPFTWSDDGPVFW
ncbi:hypothetical protein GF377_04305 [candidate division GN15 bacterium]|nr:hypothetical protein [candidate division GN15 bacterium]